MKKTILIFALLFNININAQTIDPPQSLDIVMEVVANDNTMSIGDTLFKANTVLNGRAIIVLSDTIGVKKISLKLGNVEGGSNYINQSFLFSQQPANPTMYRREGNVVYINLGNFTGINTYFAQVQLEDNQGGLTPIVKFNNVD